jgi:hypothetical protein
MKKLTLMILFAFLIISGKQMFGQTATATDSLLCREWKPVSREENGEKSLVESAQKNDRMIFTLDHKFQIKQTGTVETGDWKYDPVTKQLIITESKDGDSVPMNIVTLTKKELVLELLDPDAGSTRIYMVSAPQ